MRRPLLDVMLSDEAVETLLSDDAQLAAMLRVESALAEAEADTGLITRDAASRIVEALAEFTPDWTDLATGLVRDGVVVPNLVAQLRKAVGTEHAAALHRGATSQDIIDTALMLQLKPIIALFVGRLEGLERGIAGLIARDGGRPLMAHTRMQAALPFTVSAKLLTWSAPLQRHRHDLAQSELAIQLGGPIGDRSTLGDKGNDVARLMAQALGLADAPAWHSSRARIATICSHLAQVTGTLGKIGADIALLAQTEVGTITLDQAGGSSAMAHKANPVGAELLVSLARHNAVLVSGAFEAMIHEQERSGSAWALEWLILPQMLRNSGGALRIASHLLDTIHFS